MTPLILRQFDACWAWSPIPCSTVRELHQEVLLLMRSGLCSGSSYASCLPFCGSGHWCTRCFPLYSSFFAVSFQILSTEMSAVLRQLLEPHSRLASKTNWGFCVMSGAVFLVSGQSPRLLVRWSLFHLSIVSAGVSCSSLQLVFVDCKRISRLTYSILWMTSWSSNYTWSHLICCSSTPSLTPSSDSPSVSVLKSV